HRALRAREYGRSHAPRRHPARARRSCSSPRSRSGFGPVGIAPPLLARHRTEADVAAAEAARPADAVDRLVSTLLRLADRPAQRADIEYAPAVGDDAPALRLGAGVEDFH